MIKTYIPINYLKVGEIYTQVFMITEVLPRMTHTKVTFSDITGSLEGCIWNITESLNQGMFIEATVKIKLIKGQPFFHTSYKNVRLVDETPDNIDDYIRGSNNNILDSYAAELIESIQTTDDQAYRNILNNAYARLELINALQSSPFGLEGPTAYPGGLLVHAVHTARIAREAAGANPEGSLNQSLILAGAILRNIGWYTTTYFEDSKLRVRDAYYLTGILRASTRFIDHLILSTENDLETIIPEEKKQALTNLCQEKPLIRTLEGRVVALADEISTTLTFGNTRIKTGNWSKDFFVGHL